MSVSARPRQPIPGGGVSRLETPCPHVSSREVAVVALRTRGRHPERNSGRAGQAGRRTGIDDLRGSIHSKDEGFLSFTRWRDADDPFVLPLLPPESETTRIEGEDFYEQGEPDTPHGTYTAALRPRSLDYRLIFALFASSELDRSPSIGGRAYLLNASTPLIFHMYDDRGAMLVGSNENALAELRTGFADWIIP